MLDEQSDITRSCDKIHPQAVARAASDCAIRRDLRARYRVEHAVVRQLTAQTAPQRIIGSFNNAAVGTAVDRLTVFRRSIAHVRSSR